MHSPALSNALVQAHIEDLRRARHDTTRAPRTTSRITRGIAARLSTYIRRTTQGVEIVGNTPATRSVQPS
jgi:hypothetical protein